MIRIFSQMKWKITIILSTIIYPFAMTSLAYLLNDIIDLKIKIPHLIIMFFIPTIVISYFHNGKISPKEALIYLIAGVAYCVVSIWIFVVFGLYLVCRFSPPCVLP